MFGSLVLLLTSNTLPSQLSLPEGKIFFTSLALSIATNGITTMIIAYQLWYATLNGYRIEGLTTRRY